MPTVVPLLLGWMSNDASVMVTGGSGVMRYPIPGYAVVHERGIVLFDTGLHATLIDSTAELRGLAKVFTIELTGNDLVEARLTANGIDAEEITHVVNSHLHFDHCGRNGPFAHATTLLQADEWEAAHHPGPTPGHTAGHQSLLVRAADRPAADSAMLVGDACYLHNMLTDGVFPPFAHDAERQRDTYHVLAQHEAEGTRLLFSHDVDQWDVVPDGLARGA
jgi:N-acyl homoserine lactone hydrolase